MDIPCGTKFCPCSTSIAVNISLQPINLAHTSALLIILAGGIAQRCSENTVTLIHPWCRTQVHGHGIIIMMSCTLFMAHIIAWLRPQSTVLAWSAACSWFMSWTFCTSILYNFVCTTICMYTYECVYVCECAWLCLLALTNFVPKIIHLRWNGQLL